MDYNHEKGLLSLGSNKGLLYNYRLHVEVKNYMKESEVGKSKTTLVLEKDLCAENGEVILEKDIF